VPSEGDQERVEVFFPDQGIKQVLLSCAQLVAVREWRDRTP
jgi:hypothetical protein